MSWNKKNPTKKEIAWLRSAENIMNSEIDQNMLKLAVFGSFTIKA